MGSAVLPVWRNVQNRRNAANAATGRSRIHFAIFRFAREVYLLFIMKTAVLRSVRIVKNL